MKTSLLFNTLLFFKVVLFSTQILITSALAEKSLDQRRLQSLQALDDIRKELSLSDSTRDEIVDQIKTVDLDRQSINKQLIETSQKSRKLELKIARIGIKHNQTEGRYAEFKSSLAAKSGLMAEVLAALQRMGRNPPPALLVTPQDALISVRSSILLGSVVPEIRSQTNQLLNELNEIAKIRNQLRMSRLQLTEILTAKLAQETKLSLLIQEKQRLSRSARSKLAENEVAAAKLAARASSIQSLIGQLEKEIDVVKDVAKAAAQASKLRQKTDQRKLQQTKNAIKSTDFDDNSRITPALEFAQAKSLLPKPVSGIITQVFGALNEFGEKGKSTSIATLANARVISPADGWVVYSGPFKSYGQMLILNAGTKHHIILSGMENINVELGQFVLLGEPIGVMGTRRIASAQNIDVELTRPVLSIEFRHNGRSIDPAAWWQDETTIKVEQ